MLHPASRPRHAQAFARHALVAGLVLTALGGAARGQAAEFRALWATRFEWPDPSPTITRDRIDALLNQLADAQFNAVFFQIRGQADVLYPSPEEPWSPLIGAADPGWDPVAYAIGAAHARGLEFHAYINTHTCWQSAPGTAQTPPSDPNHLFYRHCYAPDPARRDWLHHTHPTQPAQYNSDNYVWLAPGVPACQAYVRRQVLHVVASYNVDGVHFDRIRTPGAPSYDPLSLARFGNPQSNPDGLDFTAWTADQITRFVRDTYAAALALKPHVKFSAAVLPNPGSATSLQHQDARAWAQAGALDALVPMLYSVGGPGSLWDQLLVQWLAGAGDRLVVAGHSAGQGIASLFEQIALTRTRGGAGNSVFSWGGFTWWNAYASGPYATAAATPPMPWKDAATLGVIYGYITDPNGTPVVDAQVRRNGSLYTALSSGDGFYSFLLVTPGVQSVTASYPGFPPHAPYQVSVQAGQAARRDIVLGTGPAPLAGDYDVDGDIDHGDFLAGEFCCGGPGATYLPGFYCLAGDTDGDQDIDLCDLAGLQSAFGFVNQ
jgi:uncharacterized lipoprotein YddW (UPF0748 family)